MRHEHRADSSQGFSIIIPVLKEAGNIPRLLKRISRIQFEDGNFEVILIDDNSQDGTVELVSYLKIQYSWLKLIVRQEDRSWAKSVLEGVRCALYPLLIFMDADLSHPPEKIPQMLALLKQPDVDMVIGSRYVQQGGIDKKWPFYRSVISRLAAGVIKPLLPSSIKDPLSGFIAIKKENHAVNGHAWNPIGAKMGLEILVKSPIKNIVEIPIYFEQRKQGSSKLLNMKMALLYLKQVNRLWTYKLFRQKSR